MGLILWKSDMGGLQRILGKCEEDGEQTWENNHHIHAYFQNCEFEPIVGECGLVGGPSGPHKYFQHDFPQPPACGLA